MPRAAECFAKRVDPVSIEGAMADRPHALHFQEYLIEAVALGAFMMSAAAFATLLYHPASPMSGVIPDGHIRRAVMGLAMASTAVTIIYSGWGQRSGAHMNPAVTLTFFRLGKVARADLVGYVAAQFAGGLAGIAMATLVLGMLLADPAVNYVTTKPGTLGNLAAFLAETAMSFGMMLTVLSVSNHPRLARFTGISAGLLVWIYITIEAPVSGMSMNPARTLGPALLAHDFPGLWIYFTAPPLGMLLAAELYTRRVGVQRVRCAKLHHPAAGPCIFGCDLKPSPPARIEAA